MQPLVEKYKPETLDAFVGMERPRAILSKLAESPYSSAWLLLGASGLGKTTMALALAAKIGAEIHHIPSRKCDLETVDQVVHRCFYVPLGGGDRFHLILVDEADQMSRAAQHAFLSKLDTTAAPPNTIFIFTANDTALLESRFLSRCRTLKFNTDGLLEPTVALLARIWESEAPKYPVPDVRAIASAARMNIRQAIMDLEIEMIAARAGAPCQVHQAAAVTSERSVDPRRPAAGTVLSRIFRDRKIVVRVLDEGFQFDGRKYKSLSAIAKEVAQGNRNGYAFFGLGA